MKLGKHINELLHDYDCVVVPNFGGFVASYKPSRINKVNHKFYPPGKHIIFNKHLRNNDGLLANSIATSKNCSFEEAMNYISREVKKMERKLKNKERVHMKGVGTLHRDIDANLVFETDNSINFLSEAYGLQVFQSLPVQEESKKEGTRVIPITGGVELAKVARIAAAASVLIAAFWIPIKTDVIQNAGLDKQFKNILSSPETKYISSPSNIQFDASSLEDNGSDSNLSGTDKISFLENSELNDGTKKALRLFDENTIKVTAVEVNTIGKYQIVGGCFEVEENANKFVRRLKRKGYNASITGQRNGLHVVAYSTFNNRDSAIEFLQVVKTAENSSAWLLAK